MRRPTATFLALALFLLSACTGRAAPPARPAVSGSPAAVFAYREDKGYKLITSESASLTTFDSLLLKPSEEAFAGPWIYRIVFSPAAYVKDGEECEILFGKKTSPSTG